MMSKLRENEEIIKVTAVAVPLVPGKESIKLELINEFQIGTNTYKQFILSVVPLNSGELFEAWALQSILTSFHGNFGFITSLILRNCRLSYIPKELYVLSLKELDLSCNLLEYIPECLYFGLADLEFLNLSSNSIKNFRIRPKCVEKLKVLHLDDCMLEEIPIWIQEMKAIILEELYFSRNTLKKYVFNWVQRSDYLQFPVRLRKIILNNTGLFQNMLVLFGSFHLLQYLDLSNDTHSKMCNSVLDINKLVHNASWFRHIQILKLRKLHISDLSEAFTELVNLKVLDLRDNILWDLPVNMCNLTHLVVLDVSQNRLYKLPELSVLQKLEELHLANNFFRNITLINMPRLKYLDLYDNDLEYLELSPGSLETIEYIDLETNSSDAEILLSLTDISIDNYKERRESLRERGQYKCREIGKKLINIDLESSTENDVGLNSWNGLDDDQDTDCSYALGYDDNDDDWSDLEVGATPSDSEFLPEDVLTGDIKEKITKAIDLDHSLFIDAD